MWNVDPEPQVLNPYQVRARLQALAHDQSLLAEENLLPRTEALDLLDLAEEISQMPRWSDALSGLGLEGLRSRLREANAALFRDAQATLTSQEVGFPERRRYLDRFTAYRPGGEPEGHMGRDGLDLLLDGVMGLGRERAGGAPSRHPDMVHYVPTPARAVLDLLDHAAPWPLDRSPGPQRVPGTFCPQEHPTDKRSGAFTDLGSGLGRVVILYHLLTGRPAYGVEVEPAYVSIARRSAERLGLGQVRFVHADARHADLSGSDLFFMFTPFEGGILDAVFQRLEDVAQRRTIRLCTYGTVTLAAEREPWLEIVDPRRLHAFKLAAFRSVLRR